MSLKCPHCQDNTFKKDRVFNSKRALGVHIKFKHPELFTKTDYRNPYIPKKILEALQEFIMSRESDILQDIEDFGILQPALFWIRDLVI